MKKVILREVCEIDKGQTITRSACTPGDIPVIAGGQAPAYYHGIANRPEGTITISASGAYAGFVNYWEIPIFASDCTTLISNSASLRTDYLYKFLRSKQHEIYSFQRGAGQPHVYGKDIGKIEIPLPSIETQHKIVAILDKAQELIELRKFQMEKMDEFLRSVFLDMFGDTENLTKRWKRDKLGNYITIVGGYAFASEDFVEKGVPLIKIGTINKGYFDVAALSFWPYQYGERIRKYEVYPKDLLITLTGTVGKDDYGNVCIVPSLYEKYLLNQRVAKIEPNLELHKCYLLYCFKQEKLKHRLTSLSRGVRQANISNNDIAELEINIPPLPLQTQFAAIVEKTEAQKALMLQSLTEMENNFNSLMQRAFRGEPF